MSIEKTFEQCAEDVMKLKSEPTNDEMLDVYAYYKQATIGDCNTTCPPFYDLKGAAKWNKWNSKKGLSSPLAKEAYVKLVERLKNTYGF